MSPIFPIRDEGVLGLQGVIVCLWYSIEGEFGPNGSCGDATDGVEGVIDEVLRKRCLFSTTGELAGEGSIAGRFLDVELDGAGVGEGEGGG